MYDVDACPVSITVSIASFRSGSVSSSSKAPSSISLSVVLAFSMYSVISSLYVVSPFAFTKFTSFSTSLSDMNAPWILTGFGAPVGKNNISPLPSNFSAPTWSKIVLESTWEDTANAILDGIFALIKPVTTSTDGRCVAITKCIPAALAFCANLQIASSTSPFATIIKSANSSTIITICGSFPKLSSFSITSL